MRATPSSFIRPVVEWRRSQPDTLWNYSNLNLRQREVARAVRSGQPGRLLMSELAPVITKSRRTLDSDILYNAQALNEMGIELCSTDRGGFATYHGPGQWVAFPVERLDLLTGDTRGVKRAVEGLLDVAYQVAKLYNPSVEIRDGAQMGVWSPRGKVASIGVHVEEGVLLHGLSLNGYRTPTSFQGLRPCGLDAQVDFLLGEEGEFVELGELLACEMIKKFWPTQDLQLTREPALAI